jgi:hypothetical protein
MPRGVYITRTNTGHGRDWPQPVLDDLASLLDAGKSYEFIRAHMVKAHHYVTTKNALIGKAHRLGLFSRNRMAPAATAALERKKADPRMKPERKKPVPKAKPESSLLRKEGDPGAKATGYRRLRSQKEIAIARKGYIPPATPSAPSTATSFGDLARHQCRWPCTHDATMACGGKATIGSYCDEHAVIAYRTMPTKRRNASIRKEPDIDRERARAFDAECNAAIEHYLDKPRAIGVAHAPSIVGGALVSEDEDAGDVG